MISNEIPTSFAAALRLLALPADEQIVILQQLGCKGVVDELGLQFDDHLPLAKRLHREGLLSDNQLRIVFDLDAHLAAISGAHNSALWTEDALRTSPKWEVIRRLSASFFDNN